MNALRRLTVLLVGITLAVGSTVAVTRAEPAGMLTSEGWTAPAPMAPMAPMAPFVPAMPVAQVPRHESVPPAPVAPEAPVTVAAATLPAPEPEPVTSWDACRPITVLVNDVLAPGGARDALWRALGELADATDLVFRDGGRTTTVPTSGWLRSARDAAVVVVAWAPRAATDVLLPGSAATAGWYALDGEPITTGFVVVDATPGLHPLSPEVLATLLLHELGHVVGLVHVDDPSQIMYPTVSDASPDAYTRADLVALEVLTPPCR